MRLLTVSKKAAYLYLPRNHADTVARSSRIGAMVLDRTPDGRVIGIEILTPTKPDDVDKVLADLRHPPLTDDERERLIALTGE